MSGGASKSGVCIDKHFSWSNNVDEFLKRSNMTLTRIYVKIIHRAVIYIYIYIYIYIFFFFFLFTNQSLT